MGLSSRFWLFFVSFYFGWFFFSPTSLQHYYAGMSLPGATWTWIFNACFFFPSSFFFHVTNKGSNHPCIHFCFYYYLVVLFFRFFSSSWVVPFYSLLWSPIVGNLVSRSLHRRITVGHTAFGAWSETETLELALIHERVMKTQYALSFLFFFSFIT